MAKIALDTAVGTVLALTICGTVAGAMGTLNNRLFWQGFAESIQGNAVDALVTSFAFSAVTVAASNIIKCFQCFKAGTLVETEEGLKPIEEVKVGDKVLSYDEETGEKAYKPVVKLFRNTTEEWYHIFVNGEEIVCTGGHPFYVASLDKFVPARELKAGQTLLLSDDKCVIIEDVKRQKLYKRETTYNLEVEDFHTYYVTESNILVHNKCKNPYDYLDDALEQNGYTRKDISDLVSDSPDGQWKYTWNDRGTKYQVRIHAGNSQFTNSKYIFRVARQTYGSGWQYLGLNNQWYKEAMLKPFFKGGFANPNFSKFGAIMTHLSI